MNEFNPERAKAEARRLNPTLDAAYRRQEDEKSRYLSPVIDYFALLEAEIVTMPIAARFRRDKGPNFELAGIQVEQLNPNLLGLNEADFKRAELVAILRATRAAAMSVIGRIEDLVINIEATKTD